MKKEVIQHPSEAYVYPRAVKAGNWIFIAAAGVDDELKTVGPSFEEQLDHIFNEMKKTLESLGSSMENIVQMTMYYVDMARDLEKVGPIWEKYFPADNPPMTAGIGVKELMPIDPPLCRNTLLGREGRPRGQAGLRRGLPHAGGCLHR